jgi:hypothetical protein
VIGIQIALQINNWNKGKKILATGKRIFIALYKEFEEKEIQ